MLFRENSPATPSCYDDLVTTVQAAPITFDEFMRIPDPAAGHLELHDGEVVTVPPRTHSHARIQQLLFLLLHPLVWRKGFLNIELPFRTSGNELWQADLAFVVEERSDIPDPYLVGAPDWVIEVLSPSNTVSEMNQKIDVCMKNGCRSFWLVDPKRRTVSVTEHRVDAVTARSGVYLTSHFTASDSIVLPSPLEGNIAVDSILGG